MPHSNEWIIYFDQIDYNCRGESDANKHPDQACWISHGINSKYGPDNSPKTHTCSFFWCYLWILITPVITWYSHPKLDLQSLLGDFLSPGFWWQIISRLRESTPVIQTASPNSSFISLNAVIFALFIRMWALACTLSLFFVFWSMPNMLGVIFINKFDLERCCSMSCGTNSHTKTSENVRQLF